MLEIKIPANLQRLEDMPENVTKAEVAAKLYPTTTYDYALPHEWMLHCIQNQFDPRPSVVWGYPAGTIMGVPLPLTLDALEELQRLFPMYQYIT